MHYLAGNIDSFSETAFTQTAHLRRVYSARSVPCCTFIKSFKSFSHWSACLPARSLVCLPARSPVYILQYTLNIFKIPTDRPTDRPFFFFFLLSLSLSLISFLSFFGSFFLSFLSSLSLSLSSFFFFCPAGIKRPGERERETRPVKGRSQPDPHRQNRRAEQFSTRIASDAFEGASRGFSSPAL